MALLTSKQLFLFAVVLINLDMVRQFIPFVRLDGYWLLADLTGIPDLFSMMRPFVLSLIPGRRSVGTGLPELKSWVKIAFAIYTLGTIPVLVYLFFVIVRSLPLLTVESWRGLVMQVHLFSEAASTDYWTLIAVAISMLFLVLPVLGSLLLMLLTLTACARYLMRWSRHATLRRAVALAAALVCLVGVTALWYGQLPQLRSSWNRPLMAQAPDNVLAQSQAATASIKTLRADVEGAIGPTAFSGKITLKRPNFAYVKVRGAPDLGEFQVISNGKKAFTLFPEDNSVVEVQAGSDGHNIRAYVIEQVENFFRADQVTARKSRARVRELQQETLDGTTYDVVVLQNVVGSQTSVYRSYISPADKLVHRVVTITQGKDSEYAVSWCQLNNIRINEAIDDSTFAWSPPASARPLGLPANVTTALGNVGRQ
jgi:outer membrane lipoprotein-sorting protein